MQAWQSHFKEKSARRAKRRDFDAIFRKIVIGMWVAVPIAIAAALAMGVPFRPPAP